MSQLAGALRVEGITKQFPGVLANDNISLSVNKGEILAIVGENGAGKSTLMSILYGYYRQDGGSIYVNEKPEDIDSPTKAIALGIGMVFQHFMLVPTLSVYQNIILGCEPIKGPRINEKEAIDTCKALADQYGFNIDVTAKVETLSLGMQQKVEILKMLYRKAQIMILDEPTAVLTPNEVNELFATLRKFADQGKTIIFITHKLKEVMAFSDKITVIRKGALVGTVKRDDVTEEKLAEMMVGRSVVLRVEKKEKSLGSVMVKVDHINCKSIRNACSLKNISFDIHRGEVLGIAGIEGNGQTELLEILTGLRRADSGTVHVNEQMISNLPPKAIRNKKVIHIPEDRHKRGLVLAYSVKKNLIMGIHDKNPFATAKGIVNQEAIEKNADLMIERYDIRGGGKNVTAGSLSGGNQQKIIIAREFEQEHDFLIAAQPTRGVDVGAIEFIHKKILESRDAGKAVLLISADLQEVMSLSDRIAILFEGEFMGIVDAAKTDQTELGLMMGGQHVE